MIELLNRILDSIEKYLMMLLMFAATIVTIVQVAARYVFNNSLYWSEEFILYALITMSFLAASMGVRYSAHISVEAIYAFVGPRVARLLKVFSAILGLVFAGSIIYYGGRLFLNTLNMGQLSTAMQIPVAYVYFIIPLSGVFMLIRYMLVFKQMALFGKYQPLTTEASAG
jgi:TRAP-type C4-dicarboxylate transport system, small permease component